MPSPSQPYHGLPSLLSLRPLHHAASETACLTGPPTAQGLECSATAGLCPDRSCVAEGACLAPPSDWPSSRPDRVRMISSGFARSLRPWPLASLASTQLRNTQHTPPPLWPFPTITPYTPPGSLPTTATAADFRRSKAVCLEKESEDPTRSIKTQGTQIELRLTVLYGLQERATGASTRRRPTGHVSLLAVGPCPTGGVQHLTASWTIVQTGHRWACPPGGWSCGVVIGSMGAPSCGVERRRHPLSASLFSDGASTYYTYCVT